MMIRKSIKKGILIASAFFLFFLLLFGLRNRIQHNEATPQEKAAIDEYVKVTVTTEDNNLNANNWKYFIGDNIAYSLPNVNDSAWLSINPELDIDSVPKEFFNSVVWFRKYITVSAKRINSNLALNIEHYGASEIYIDGKLIKKFGEVSSTPKKEIASIPDFPILLQLPDTNKHLLAVRYSNLDAIKFYKENGENMGGFKISLAEDTDAAISAKKGNYSMAFIFLTLFGFSFTLSFLHALFYLFYPKQKQNLYFSIFMIVFALVVIKPFLTTIFKTPTAYFFYIKYSLIPPLLLLPTLVICLYSLFPVTHRKILFSILLIITIITLLCIYVEVLNDYDVIAWVALIIFTTIESFRIIITALTKKLDGSKVIGIGVLIFLTILITGVIMGFLTGSMNINARITGFYGILILLLSMITIVSIPLSMSIYLAGNFASTNKHLSNKLIEVEELSNKNLQQEKEKQEILASQNEVLEHQVTERTQEILKQKQTIEEKHKEITDSINYAERIQRSFLATEDHLKENLKEYFIFFKPKDVVSGDFYWSATLNNNHFILATADSTGHGVPGAIMSLLNITSLEKAIETQTQPHEILNTTRKIIIERLKKDGSAEGGKDGMDCSLCAYDFANKKVFIAAANNPVWIVRQTEVIEIKPDKMPVGKHDRQDVPFTLHEINLQKDDVIYTLTDGFSDQFGGEKNKKFMSKNLRELLAKNAHLSLHEQKQLLETTFTDWVDNIEQIDDVTVIGIRV